MDYCKHNKHDVNFVDCERCINNAKKLIAKGINIEQDIHKCRSKNIGESN